MNLFDKIKENRRHKQEEDRVISTLEEIIDEREERGDDHLVDAREIPMMKNLFSLRDVRAKDVMTPRVDIAAVPNDMTATKFLHYVSKEKFTRYPVYEGSLDHIVGIIHLKDVVFQISEKKKWTIEDLMQPSVLFVSPAMRALDLLKEMQQKKVQMSVVIDEYGGVDGLVSFEDLLEVLIGEIDDEHDKAEEETFLKRLSAHTIEANAKAQISDFEEMTGIKIIEDGAEEFKDIDTLGGFVVHIAGRVPDKGEIVVHNPTGLRFMIESSNPSHVQRIKISNINLAKKEEK